MAKTNSKPTQNQHENYELKPCPFCGGKAKVYSMKRHWWTKKNLYSFIVCESCHAMTYYQNVLENAIQIWERRTPKERGGEK